MIELSIPCILGPTAVGKTDLSLELALKLNAEIVCVDSTLVYQEFDIGTAKPTHVQQAAIKHQVLDRVTANQEFKAHDFCEAAKTAIQDITKRGKRPILVGGSGFYFKALENGMLGAPPKNDDIRREIELEIQTKGLLQIYEYLKKMDPESAQKIHSHDQYRIIRALEVLKISGKPLSQFYREHEGQRQYPFTKVGIFRESGDHIQAIKLRTKNMIEAGFLDEVKSLMTKYAPDCKPFQSVGYKQAMQYINDELSCEQFMDTMNLETRHLAKNQMTWFRADKEITWLPPDADPIYAYLSMLIC